MLAGFHGDPSVSNISSNRIARTYAPAALFAIICFLAISCLVPPAQAKGSKEGSVLYAASKADFVFTDLGEKEVKVGTLVEVYRHSEYLATFVIKDVKPEMSEAWSLSTDKNLAINIGDRVVVPDTVSGAISIASAAAVAGAPELLYPENRKAVPRKKRAYRIAS